MGPLLALSRTIDALNGAIGRIVYWLILVTVIISASNAVVRKLFNVSSNAFLEIQWYFFSAIFLLCGAYTLLHNQHVRIDVVVGRFSRQTLAWIDIFGTLLFLLPMALLLMYLSWNTFLVSFASKEVSTNAGGLTIWPARLLVPVGFALLLIQGVSELIKRIAFLKGLIPDPNDKSEGPSAEEALAEEIRRQRGEVAR